MKGAKLDEYPLNTHKWFGISAGRYECSVCGEVLIRASFDGKYCMSILSPYSAPGNYYSLASCSARMMEKALK